ncbi:hypothetical protein CCHR01_16989 [Colletotrichum chrysophilum]|uniref:Uncharacterized protein n=1 Tax=Colletotrichum chrysophilum TaxID=1836956 RepID=A0AAD9A3E7_9PEZI|nr:hypothetical protein CCHR01_16989 [Colletotrichum chrysophilum]
MAAASTADTVDRLHAFNRGEIDIPGLEMLQIIDTEILKSKQPFTTTHKVMFTNTFGAHKAIALVLSQLSPDCKKIAFIMKGGKDDCEEALAYAFGHLIDTVRAGPSMENDEDINTAEMVGSSGLYILSKTNDVDEAWGDLDWLINTINGPQDIRHRQGPIGVQFTSV